MGKITISDIRSILEDNVVIFEIGSNIGNDTGRFLKNFSNIKIYCFEPDPRCIEKFKKRISDNRVTLVEVAVSDIHEQEIDFYLSSGSKKNHKSQHINSSSIKEPYKHLEKHPWCNFNEKIKVRTVNLDSWCRENDINSIDFLWADVQGAEENLINGAKDILSRTKYFYTEYSDEELYKNQINKKDILRLLPGFRVMKDYGNNLLLENREI